VYTEDISQKRRREMTTKDRSKHVYLDLDVLKAKESPEAVEMGERLKNRVDLANTAKEGKEADERRKTLDAEIMAFLKAWGADGFILGGSAVEITNSRGAGKWDKGYLEAILTPEQLERAYTPGSPFSYPRVYFEDKQVKRIRSQLGGKNA
jgi:hypothetical protein